MIYGSSPFSMALNHPNPNFKVTPIFDADISVTVQDRDTFTIGLADEQELVCGVDSSR